jgi:putative spermidine/putrescine transport system substrate-binding protein
MTTVRRFEEAGMLGVEQRSTRREVLKRAGALASAAAVPSVLAACGDSASDAESRAIEGIDVTSDIVVVADFGGTTREARKRVYFDPFTQKTGIGVITPDFDPAKYELMATRGRSQWDGADTPPLFAVKLADKNALQRFPASVTRSEVVSPPYRDFDTAGYTISINQGYLKKQFGGRGPESWADFWDLKKFPGKRAVSVGFYMIEPALLADGVPPDQLYPLDFDRAFAKLEEIREHTLFYKSLAEGQLYLQAGTVAIAQLTNGRLYGLKQQGVDVEVVWNEALYQGWNGATVPNGAPHADAMFALSQFMMDPQRQATFSEATGYGPGNPKALELMDDALLAEMPNSPEHLEIAVTVDPTELVKQQTEYVEKTTAWLAG